MRKYLDLLINSYNYICFLLFEILQLFYPHDFLHFSVLFDRTIVLYQIHKSNLSEKFISVRQISSDKLDNDAATKPFHPLSFFLSFPAMSQIRYHFTIAVNVSWDFNVLFYSGLSLYAALSAHL